MHYISIYVLSLCICSGTINHPVLHIRQFSMLPNVAGSEKRGNFAQIPFFWFQNAYNFEAIIATDLKRAMNILTSSWYTLARIFKPHPLPVWVWRVHILLPAVWNRLFYTSLWRLTARGRRQAVAFNFGSLK